ncbi:MAG: OsmC family peroxiredoxin [Terriglobales bacterium]
MIREAAATWTGGPYAGEGKISTRSGTLSNVVYAFGSGRDDGPCTSPCEMLAAAHAACISMKLANELNKEGMKPEKVETHSTITLEPANDSWAIKEIRLDVHATTSELDGEKFHLATKRAREACPITSALKVPIHMENHMHPSGVEVPA